MEQTPLAELYAALQGRDKPEAPAGQGGRFVGGSRPRQEGDDLLVRTGRQRERH